MSTITSLGSSSDAWATAAGHHAGGHKARLFKEADTDGSGSVDKTELQSFLDDVSAKTGATFSDAGDLLSKMDTDGNGTLDASELDAGMKNLLPPPSTLNFAQQRQEGTDSAVSGLSADSASATGAAPGADAISQLFDQLDADGDGSISKSEFESALAAASGSGDLAMQGMPPPPPGPPPFGSADGSASASSTTGTTSASSSDSSSPTEMTELNNLLRQMMQQYQATAASGSSAEALVNLAA